MNESYLRQPGPADYMTEEAIRAVIEGAKKSVAAQQQGAAATDEARLDEELSLIREEEELLSEAEASNRNLRTFISVHNTSRKEREEREARGGEAMDHS